VLSRSLAYASRRIGEIADDVVSVDEAMKWGYNWELGPFETWDAMGFDETLARMQRDGIHVPDAVKRMKERGADGFYSVDGVWDFGLGQYKKIEKDPRIATVVDLRRSSVPVLKNDGAEAWDLGDGVLGL